MDFEGLMLSLHRKKKKKKKILEWGWVSQKCKSDLIVSSSHDVSGSFNLKFDCFCLLLRKIVPVAFM